MDTLRVLTCLSGLVACSLPLVGCGDDGSASTGTDSASQGTTNPDLTGNPPTSTEPTTASSMSATESASGTVGETQGQTTTTGPTTGTTATSEQTGTSTAGETTAEATTATTGPVSGTTTEGTGPNSTGPDDTSTGNAACQPGDPNMGGDVEKSYLWVANSDQGTISKVDTQKVLEIARYRSGPLGENYLDNPSRTAVSVDGRFVVVNNRQSGHVTMIAANEEDCVDKNANGTIETSKSKDDILAWGADECIRWSTKMPIQGQIGSGPRGVTWTPGEWDENTCSFLNPKVWVGYLPVQAGVAHMVRIDGGTGTVEETVVINNWTQGWTDYGPYGAALDKDLKVWFTGLRGELFRVNTDQNPITFDRWTPSADLQFYGMTVDPEGDPWFGGCSGPVSTFNPATQTFTAVAGTSACYRGLAADKEGNVWVASNGPCGVVQIDYTTNQLVQFHNLDQCSTPVGVSVDDEGFVWVVDEYVGAWKIDPLNPNNKTLLPIANDHYTYSDMTGGQLKSVVLPQ